MFNSNFDVLLQLTAAGIVVNGNTSEIDDASLVMRRVMFQQDGKVAEGATNLAMPRWGISALAAPGFTGGEALALGTETYKVTGPTPAYATFTWSQIVTLETS
jgi:hypothetical protein